MKLKFEYGFQSVNGIISKKYYLHEIPNIAQKCDIWNGLPIVYVRQFCGFDDRNGKSFDWWEGDILHLNQVMYPDEEHVIVIVRKDGCFMGKYYENGKPYLNGDGDELIMEIDYQIKDMYFKVGNIHENTDLLIQAIKKPLTLL